MPDQDLSGNDLKYVSYSILFTKRDYEATLREATEELIDYATDGASFGALKILEFGEDLGRGTVPFPEEWAGVDLPPGYREHGRWTVPERDRKYITFVFRVAKRLAKTEAEYDRRKTEALEQIAETLGKVK